MTPKNILQRCQRLINKHVDQSNTNLISQLNLFNQLAYNYLGLSDKKYAYLKASLLRTLIECLYLRSSPNYAVNSHSPKLPIL